MKNFNTIIVRLRAVLVFIYAFILFLLIPLFFINYNGEWMQRIAEKLPIQERPNVQSCNGSNR